MKIGIVALVVRFDQTQPVLLEAVSNENEIAALDTAIQAGSSDPLAVMHSYREKSQREDEEFGDYVEGILTQPFLKPEVRDHALAWFQSKLKIETFNRQEIEATKVIAQYALKILLEHPDRRDFVLTGNQAAVRVRIFELSLSELRKSA